MRNCPLCRLEKTKPNKANFLALDNAWDWQMAENIRTQNGRSVCYFLLSAVRYSQYATPIKSTAPSQPP